MFMGGLILFAPAVTWLTGLMMSPHGDSSAPGTEHVKTVVVTFLRNSALGTLVLSALSAWLLFPARRPKWPARDWTIIGLVGLMVATSVYQLIWLRGMTG